MKLDHVEFLGKFFTQEQVMFFLQEIQWFLAFHL